MSEIITVGVGLSAFVAGWWLGRPTAKRIHIDDAGHWHFPIDTLREMLRIPAERRSRFLAEMPDMFRNMWDMMDKFPTTPAAGAYWIDDSLGEFRPEVANPFRNMDPELERVRPLKGDDA